MELIMRKILHIVYCLAVLLAASVATVCCSDLGDTPQPQQRVNAVLMRIMPESDKLQV